MTRLLGLVILGFLLWLMLESLLDRARGSLSGRPRPGMPRKERAAAAEVLVRCAGCGVYVPQSRAKAESGAAAGAPPEGEAGAPAGGSGTAPGGTAPGRAVYCERCSAGPEP